ncbi:MAG: SMC-Scp complex subunit ScpB [Myxococcaceae bacterium]
MNTDDPTVVGDGDAEFDADDAVESVDDIEAAAIEEAAADVAMSFEEVEARAQALDEERIRRVVESVLFVAERPVTVDQLHDATGVPEADLEKALEQLSAERAEGKTGVALYAVGGGWQLRSAPECADYVRRFLRVKPQRLTRPALETLSIIAYRQPVTRPEIEDVRGVDSGGVLKALLDRRLIQILGKKEELGRPLLYGTTREFLEFFALKDLSSMPTLREFQELSTEHQALVDAQPAPTTRNMVAELADSEFTGRLEAERRASESALTDLEEAMAIAESRAKEAAAVFATPLDGTADRVET